MQLRDATRRLGEPWPSWRRTSEESAQRCQAPLAGALEAVRACFVEALPAPLPTPSTSSVPADPAELHTLHRRTS
jgi:hypothetical protein